MLHILGVLGLFGFFLSTKKITISSLLNQPPVSLQNCTHLLQEWLSFSKCPGCLGSAAHLASSLLTQSTSSGSQVNQPFTGCSKHSLAGSFSGLTGECVLKSYTISARANTTTSTWFFFSSLLISQFCKPHFQSVIRQHRE